MDSDSRPPLCSSDPLPNPQPCPQRAGPGLGIAGLSPSQGVGKGGRKRGAKPLPVQLEAGEQLTWRFQTRAEEAGATGLSQHIREAGAKRLAQLVSRTGLNKVREVGVGVPQMEMGGRARKMAAAPPYTHLQPAWISPGCQGPKTALSSPPPSVSPPSVSLMISSTPVSATITCRHMMPNAHSSSSGSMPPNFS